MDEETSLEEQLALEKTVRAFIIAVAMIIALIVTVLFLDEAIYGIVERRCVENNPVSADGWNQCDL